MYGHMQNIGIHLEVIDFAEMSFLLNILDIKILNKWPDCR